jgi:hypothetical protein
MAVVGQVPCIRADLCAESGPAHVSFTAVKDPQSVGEGIEHYCSNKLNLNSSLSPVLEAAPPCSSAARVRRQTL